MEKDKIVNRRVLTCERGHKSHEPAYPWEDAYKIQHSVKRLSFWKCPKCKGDLRKVEIVKLHEISIMEAEEIAGWY
jgi:hypothetical protein